MVVRWRSRIPASIIQVVKAATFPAESGAHGRIENSTFFRKLITGTDGKGCKIIKSVGLVLTGYTRFVVVRRKLASSRRRQFTPRVPIPAGAQEFSRIDPTTRIILTMRKRSESFLRLGSSLSARTWRSINAGTGRGIPVASRSAPFRRSVGDGLVAAGIVVSSPGSAGSQELGEIFGLVRHGARLRRILAEVMVVNFDGLFSVLSKFKPQRERAKFI